MLESGRLTLVSKFKALNANVLHTIEASVGSINVDGPRQRERLLELLERAFSAGNDSVVVMLPAASNLDLLGPFGPRLDSTKCWVHPDDPELFAPPTAHLLSFNAPGHEDSGACRACGGTGIGRRLNEHALITQPNRSMREGAFAIWTEKNYKYINVQHETIEGLRDIDGFSPDVPWSKLPASARALVLNGSGDTPIFDRERSGKKFGKARRFEGFRKILLEKSAAGTKVADLLASYVETGPCDVCGGTRWSFQARALRVNGLGIADILQMPFAEGEALTAGEGKFVRAIEPHARPFIEALHRHARSIVSVGLGYLTADRSMLNVSEGESRRIRLARALDPGETGLCLLLDEPARGLHEADLTRLSSALLSLREKHTVILNEHRDRLWGVADWFVEIGPGGGAAGGQVAYAGKRPPKTSDDNQPLRAGLPTAKQPKLTIRGATIHNVENIDAEIPLGRLTCIAGVSGSGKSSFVRGVLAPALLEAIGGASSDFALRRGRWRSVAGTKTIKEVIPLDQVMPPPNRRSLVATFTGTLDGIRDAFGKSTAAKRDGLSPSDFGMNSGEGRCPVCSGIGEVTEAEHSSLCPACGGARYGHAALSVRIDGLNVQELLDIPAERLGEVAGNFHVPQSLISAMCELGLGHVALGRRIDTLSGGEVQRLRLAMRLSVASTGSMLFILDEPAVGLHPRDVERLTSALERVLDDGGNTIVIVEHDLRLIRSADWVLEFGPGSGPDGGKIIFTGTPDSLARAKTPTGLALSGKLPIQKSKPSEQTSRAAKRALPIKEQAARTHALIRTLISGDAPIELPSEDTSFEPIVIVSEKLWAGRQAWEVGGLDLEIPKLLIDLQIKRSGDAFSSLLAEWQKTPKSWLAVVPFLSEIQVWGAEVPESAIRNVSSHISKEGLRLVTTKGDNPQNNFDVRHVRATGDRLLPIDESEQARSAALRDAYAIGAGYVELRDRSGRLQAVASDRILDLEAATVGPMAPVPAHFSRLDPQGQCPMCRGSRGVATLSDDLVIADQRATLDSDRFLTSEANVVMKGVRQNELNPFFRRLAKEGLWDTKESFKQLGRGKRELILFGFWSRPRTRIIP